MNSSPKKWVRKFTSFEEANAHQRRLDAVKTGDERVSEMQYLRTIRFNLNQESNHGKRRKRFQRTVRIIQQTQR